MITPMDIHNKTFSGQIRGYSKDEVNAFLEELASDYEKIYREHRVMEEEINPPLLVNVIAVPNEVRNYTITMLAFGQPAGIVSFEDGPLALGGGFYGYETSRDGPVRAVESAVL